MVGKPPRAGLTLNSVERDWNVYISQFFSFSLENLTRFTSLENLFRL